MWQHTGGKCSHTYQKCIKLYLLRKIDVVVQLETHTRHEREREEMIRIPCAEKFKNISTANFPWDGRSSEEGERKATNELAHDKKGERQWAQVQTLCIFASFPWEIDGASFIWWFFNDLPLSIVLSVGATWRMWTEMLVYHMNMHRCVLCRHPHSCIAVHI